MAINSRPWRWAILVVVGIGAGSAAGQVVTPDGAWTLVKDHAAAVKADVPWIRPEAGQPLVGDLQKIRTVLSGAPLEGTPEAGQHPLILELPDPTGRLQQFVVVESPIMAPELAAKFPEIHTYVGQGLTDPSATLRADVTLQGFHAQVLSPDGSWYIDPYSRLDTVDYTSYYRRDLKRQGDWNCGMAEQVPAFGLRDGGGGISMVTVGTQLRTYRLACACTGEYAAFHGGTVALAQSAIVTAINRVTGVYEVDLCIRLTLVANNSSIVYTNSATDPYSNNNGSTMLGQNQSNLTTVIGSANYDIGHVFSTGGGGVAGLGVVCNASNKARGVTGSPSPTGDAFWIDYVAHEMGHQYGANHNFQGTTNNCGGGNRNGATADEPGSGSTIMGYAGICGADDLQAHSDAYFNHISYDEIQSYIGGSGACSVITATTNAGPTVTANGAGLTIPKGTPFALTASGMDSNGDPLTYCWEDGNMGGSTGTTLATADNGVMPLFRSFNPTTSPTRYFPRLALVLSGGTDNQEKVPAVARASFRFRVTARDNRSNGGGVANLYVTMAVSGVAGPFTVTSPSSATTWPTGSNQTITWNVAGTTANGVNVANVSILLSTDGGNTFPITLVASTPNDGSETITVPSNPTTTGRIKIQPIGNVFYAINSGAITISGPACTAASVSSNPTAQTACALGSATFNVGAAGTAPLTYQWRKGGSPIGGANSPMLTINPVGAGDAGSYDCVVTNGCGTATSAAAVLTVSPRPTIFSQPTGGPACAGDTVSFNIDGSGGSTFQWRKDLANIPGATGLTLTRMSITTADAGSYDCVVSNSCGDTISNAAILTVDDPPAITLQPQTGNGCQTGSVTLAVGATGTIPILYQWQWKPSGAADWSTAVEGVNSAGAQEYFDGQGAQAASFTLRLRKRPEILFARCTVSNGCGGLFSDEVTVTYCPADYNCSGSITVQDLFDFFGGYFANDPRGDFNESGAISVQDIFDYLAAYFAGC